MKGYLFMADFYYPVIQGEKTGKKLRAMRKSRGIKVTALCHYMGGISEQAVYKWERGDCLPSIDNLLALSHLYHVAIEELLVYEEAEAVSSFFTCISGKGPCGLLADLER